MTGTDLCSLSATELAASIRARKVSPVDAVRQSLARMDRVQPILNAFAFVYPEEALEKARAAEAAVMRGEEIGPLHGVPIAIKDFTPTKGKRTTRGSYAFEHWVPEEDPVLVRRLLAAGAIMVGKTTTPEFAFSSFTRSPLWGDTVNPWDPAKCAGGSSGGSGAAVASGCVPLAEGTDMGGSVRIPAAFCGIVGLKPSLGRIPMDIVNTVFDTISHFGPLARTVEDAALFLRVTEGPDEVDIMSQRAPIPLPDPIPGDLRGLRLALSEDLGFYAVDPEVAANLRAACQALTDAGAVIEEVELAWSKEMVDAWNDIWAVYLAAAAAEILPDYRDKLDPAVLALIETGMAMDAVAYRKTEEIRTRQWHALVPILRDHDALLCPTMALPPPDQHAADRDFDEVDAEGCFHGLDMTALFNNVAQCPALSVPSGMTASGLPTAIQIVGRRFDDPTVLRIAKALEAARPWADGLAELGRRYAG
jgi:Asp-tRNA(Asn)/Glu-tRNA(Gln) amidotransferase A subunit family amidase